MAFHKDFSFEVEGDFIAYNKGKSTSAASLPPNQGISVRFTALEGKITVGASCLDLIEPTRVRVVGSHVDPEGPEEGPGSTIDEFNSVEAVIELVPPGQGTPVKRLKIPAGFSRTEVFGFEHIVPSPAPKGEWQARVINKGGKPAKVELSVGRVIDREFLRTEFLAHRLLDHAYLVVLEALQPSASLSGSTLSISFGEELREFFGESGEAGPLGRHVIQLPDGDFSISGEGHLTRFDVRARSGRALLDAVLERWQAIRDSDDSDDDDLEENDKFRQQWERRVRPDDAVVHVSAAFSDITIVAAADFKLFDVDAQGVIRNAMVDIYIAFDRNLERCDVLALSPLTLDLTDFEAELADSLGLIPELNKLIEEQLPRPIERAGRQLGLFLAEAVGRLAGRDTVFHSLTSNDNHWLVRYTAIPVEPAATGGGGGGVGGVHTGTHGQVGGGIGEVGTLDPGTGGGPGPAPDITIGVLPPADEFIVARPETLAKLDQIDHLVFIMMENRSFDHMLGYLRAARGPEYEGLHGDESNRVIGRTQPVRMIHASDIVPAPATRIPLSPNHDFEPVERQIADGAMSGFAQDFEDRHPGFAELVMTFYNGDDLRVYDQLAANYSVCDHWYCAHAGPTFPNRFVTLTGLTPALDNFAVDDPVLGFLFERTIFDLLRERGIKWAVYESDLSIIRMFNRFRLEANEVLPYLNRSDPSQSFVEVAKRGELPQVVFVEPNFVDIPPLSTATDDHPPADLRRGQNFIAEVVEALSSNPERWKRTLLAITYDEHGGFYDHVAPPGTSLGRPELIGKIPRVHPDGQDFMGPRVPSFVVSPWVSAGSVCKDTLDHTSIIKTILLRHRAKIPTRAFTQFGPRVNMINHLGVALDLDRPRDDAPPPMERMGIETAPPDPAAVAAFEAQLGPPEPDDFHQSLRRAPLPKRR